MEKWAKLTIGILCTFLVLLVFINLTLLGYLPNIVDFNVPIKQNSILNIKNEIESENNKSTKFSGTMEDAYFMCTFRKDADYWKGVLKGFKTAGDQLGVRTVYEGCDEYDANAQLLAFEQIVAKKPKGIALSPINPVILKEAINKAVDSGIKVVCFASDSPESKRSIHITSDNEQEGIASAEFMAEKMGGKGEIGIIERPFQSNHARRVKSFLKTISEKYPEIKIVDRVTADGDEAKAARLTKTMIQKHPKLKFIFCVAGIEGRGAGVGVKESGKPIKVFCFDADPPVIDMVKAGTIYAVIQPNAFNQGYWSMLSLFVETKKLSDPISDWKKTGKSPLPKMIDNGFDVVTKENGDYFYVR